MNLPQNNPIEQETLDLIKELGMDYIVSDDSGAILIQVKVINKSPFDLPALATKGSAGFDLKVNFNDDDREDVQVDSDGNKYVELKSGQHRLFKTGLYFGIPTNEMEIQLRPRSGMANKRGLIIPNAPATIDSDYTGEIMVGLYNLGFAGDQRITHGDRICQAIFNTVITNLKFKTVETLENTDRGSGGFGHTGK